jgi:hypothetical protein
MPYILTGRYTLIGNTKIFLNCVKGESGNDNILQAIA